MKLAATRQFEIRGAPTKDLSLGDSRPRLFESLFEFGHEVRKLKQADKFFDRIACLLNNRGQGLPLQFLVVPGHSHPQTRPVRVLEEIVRTGGVMNEKSGSFERSDDFLGLDGWKALAHLGGELLRSPL